MRIVRVSASDRHAWVEFEGNDLPVVVREGQTLSMKQIRCGQDLMDVVLIEDGITGKQQVIARSGRPQGGGP